MKTTFLYFGLLTTISPLSLKVRCLKYCIYLSLWAGLKTYMFKNSAPPLAQSLYSDTEICGRRRDVCSLWCSWGSRRICECLSPSHGRRGNLRSALAHTSLSDVNASITGFSQSQRSEVTDTQHVCLTATPHAFHWFCFNIVIWFCVRRNLTAGFEVFHFKFLVTQFLLNNNFNYDHRKEFDKLQK